jgi:hypothetical protein
VVGERKAGIYTRAKVSSSWQDQLGREESGSGRSEWMGKCGGGMYKRRVSGCGRVIVCRVVCPFGHSLISSPY